MGIRTTLHNWWFEQPSHMIEEIKSNPAYTALITHGDQPQPHMMLRSYKSFAKEGYRVDATIYKCISYIARNGAAIPPKLYTDRTKQTEITSHPLLDRLHHPNKEQTGIAYRETLLSYLLIAGNAYQYAITANKRTSQPEELWALRPDYIQISANSSGIKGYHYKGGGMDTIIYSPKEISHIKYWSPNDDLYGLSPMEVAAILVDQQTAARKWNLALLQNWARLPGAWVVPHPIGQNERERLEQKLKDKFSGYKNAGAPPVLDGGLVWQNMAVGPTQMDWLNGLQLNAAQIANIYSIPPMVIGDVSATTFDNMKQAEIYSYTEGIFPDLDKVYDNWNNWLIPMYPDLCDQSGHAKAYLYYDKESVEVVQEMIQEQKNARSQRATTMFAGSQITLNESRQLQGLPSIKGGDRIKLGNALIPISILEDNQIITVTSGGIVADAQNGIMAGDSTPNKSLISQEQKAWFDATTYDRIQTLRLLGVSHLQWHAYSTCCSICKKNDGMIVLLGDAFPSGHVLPQVHPLCHCEVSSVSAPLSLEPAYRDFQRSYT